MIFALNHSIKESLCLKGPKNSRERLKLDFRAGMDRKKVTLIVKQQEPEPQDLHSAQM